MKNLILAVAFAVALPSVANAQTAPAPEKECCCKKMSEKKCCAKTAEGTTGHDEHAGHDMSKMQPKN